MSDTCSERIMQRIQASQYKSVFTTCDFADIASANTVRKNLARLTRRGKIKRVLPGIYHKPEYCELIHEFVPPNSDMVASAIARQHGWTIAPHECIALNRLGLSTQMVMHIVYISDGPDKKFKFGKRTIQFEHRPEEDMTGLSCVTIMVIRSLRTLGEAKITPDVIRTLSHRLSDEDKATVLRESAGTDEWIRDAIRQIVA